MFLSCSFGYQIIFFLLSLFIVINNFILVNNEKEEDEIENKNKEEFLKLNKRIEEVERKNNILIKDNKDLLEKIKEVKKDNQILFFEHNFMVNYQNDINEKFKLNRKNDKLRVNYLLLSFSSKVKNIIAITRIVNFRKIVNCLLNHIIEKNKIYLKKTSAKFYDILKPKDNQRAFFIIYCTENKVNDVTKKAFNIIIDFLMFIHNYTSSILHLNKIENYQDIIPNIENNKNGENSPKSDSNISENKTNYSFHLNDLADYVFNSYNIEKETKEMIKKIENEEKQNIENSKNINIVSKKNGDNSNNINSEFIEYNKNVKSFGEREKNEETGCRPCGGNGSLGACRTDPDDE
jgi:L-rhamnose mutarotase